MDNIKQILALMLFSIATLLCSRALAAPYHIAIWLLPLSIACILFRPKIGYKGYSNGIRGGLCAILITYIVILSFGIYQPQWLPWPFQSQPKHQHQHLVVNNAQDLKQVLSQNQKQPVVLYFSAKWCATCQYLEHKVWGNQELSSLLKKVTLIKVDLSDNRDEQNQLMHQYKVIAPPTVILLPSLQNDSTCRLLGEEITVSHLKYWEKNLNKAGKLQTCQSHDKF